MNRISILHLEDSLIDAELIRVRLERDGLAFDLTRVDTRGGFVAALSEGRHDLILADHSLPSFDGVSALEIAREASPETPFIFVSATLGEELAVDCLKRGATDYVLKQRMERLGAAVRRALAEAEERAERRVATEALHESENRFRQLADAMPQIVFAAGPDGRVDYFNRQWYEYTGLPPGTVSFESWRHVHAPEELPRVTEAWQEAVRTGEPYEIEYPLRRADGVYRWHLGRALPVRDEGARIVRWFGTNTDIHDRKALEEALLQADRRKDQFLATLAHELRNPLAPVSNALEAWPFVKDDPAEMDRLRETMARQVRQMTRLIDDLLDVSRITRGKITLRVEPTDLRAVLVAAAEGVKPLIDARGHRLTVSVPEPPPAFAGDVTRLVQVFSNLLHNAAKYAENAGRIDVTARVEPGAGRAGRVVVSIADDGPGIPPEMLAGIFDMFVQIDDTLDRAHGGLGIGLTLVKTLVELHGGSVEARSDGLGRGSTFVVTLPLAAAPVAPDPSPTDEPALPRRRILVVDDVRPSARTLALLLKGLGQEVEVAHDGPRAIEALGAFDADVVLLDIAMPGMDGYEACRRIRERFGRRSLLVALTGYGQEEDRRRAFDAGFDRHLVKPTSLDALRTLLAGARRAIDAAEDDGTPERRDPLPARV